MGFKLDESYNTVAERIAEFRAKHPEGSLQPADLSKPFSIETINGNQCFVVTAAAYRSPDDQRPGIGMAYESVPGDSPFTRGSELQNAETAAWGRAIVAVLAADTNKGIASRDEVQARQSAAAQPPTIDWQAQLRQATGNRQNLEALRHTAQTAGAPADFWLFPAIETQLAALPVGGSEPLEGRIV